MLLWGLGLIGLSYFTIKINSGLALGLSVAAFFAGFVMVGESIAPSWFSRLILS